MSSSTRCTILLVELLNFEHVSSLLNTIEVELVPPGKCRKLRSGDVRQGVEVQPADSLGNNEEQCNDYRRLYNLNYSHHKCLER